MDRSTQAAMTMAAWAGLRSAKEASWRGLKQTTSHRPTAGRLASRVSGPAVGTSAAFRPGPFPGSSLCWAPSVGKRFSKTTTS